ncbi:ATP-binding protein [Aquimarina sp. SS2-1]|uniref:tetratricopeptide repeat-containing sensor histidine kinase n=1 Tax=Aquimarina besae TaxID=3342247 RepID=UPI0036709DD0
MKLLPKFSIILLIFILLFSCNDQDIDFENDEVKSNMIETNLSNFSQKSLSIEEKENYLMKAYGMVRTLPNTSKKLEGFQKISEGYYSLKNYEKFKNVNEKALELSKLLNDSVAMAKSYGFLGMYYRNKELDSAYKNFYKAEKIYISLDNTKRVDPLSYAFDHGRTLIDLAKLSRRVKDYGESEDLTIRAIEKFELSGNTKYLPICYTNLGILAKYVERYDDAVTYHSKAIEYAKDSSKDTLYAVLGNNNIGTVYKSQRKYDKAMAYYNKALSHKRFLSSNPKWYAALLDNLAYVNFLSKESNVKPEDFLKPLRIRDSINDLQGISTNKLHLAEYYHSIGNDSIAKTFASQAQKHLYELNNNEELLTSYLLLAKVSSSEEALGFAQAHIRLSDSLQREERLFKNEFARIRFETEEKVEKIAEISRENQLLIFAIFGLSVLSLLGYVIFKQQQSNKELLFEQKQQQSNQEIYRLLLSQQLKLEEGRKLEQHRMSEELHDGVLGRLFGVRLSLDGINQRANDGFTDARNKYIDELKSIEKEIRLISHDLGTETLSPDIAYVDVVESLVSDLCTVHKMEFEFSNDENIDWETVDDQKKVNLFRIIQESLQNIFKHAKAKSVKISFNYVDDKINLTILDDGIGFKSSKVKRGIGLKNITSRVTQMNGVVDFISNQDSGTKVSVGIPI